MGDPRREEFPVSKELHCSNPLTDCGRSEFKAGGMRSQFLVETLTQLGSASIDWLLDLGVACRQHRHQMAGCDNMSTVRREMQSNNTLTRCLRQCDRVTHRCHVAQFGYFGGSAGSHKRPSPQTTHSTQLIQTNTI